jgi:hypothetical protein
MKLQVGQTLHSGVDDTTVIVIRAPEGEVVVTCGGEPMAEAKPDAVSEPHADAREGALLGKRYVEDALGLELLCTKAGDGTLAVDGAALPIKDAKPLPSSD